MIIYYGIKKQNKAAQYVWYGLLCLKLARVIIWGLPRRYLAADFRDLNARHYVW